MSCDISVILNCHDELSYLHQTLISLGEAINEARLRSLSVEMVIVLDKPVPGLKDELLKWKKNQDFCISIYEVNFGSLGLSRNYGVSKASGKYISTADADDLISNNFLYQSFDEASNSKNAVFFPQYVYSFGKVSDIQKYFDSEYFSPSDWLSFHPYVSRIFALREIFESYPYFDLSRKSGFAFEDWDLNARLFAHNFLLKVVPNTVLFYRRRSGSILTSLSSGNSICPHNELFDIEDYSRRLLSKKVSRFITREMGGVRKLFYASPILNSFVKRANEIEPLVDLHVSSEGKNTDHIFSNWADEYLNFIKLTGEIRYDHIFLVPWLNPGGGEKYLIQMMKSILATDPTSRLLVLSCEETKKNIWRDQLPEGVIFLDFHKFFSHLPIDGQYRLLVRYLLANARDQKIFLHIKNGVFTYDFFLKYGETLSKKLKVFWYFWCNEVRKENDAFVVSKNSVSIFRDFSPFVTQFITDNRAIVSYYSERFGDIAFNKFKVIRAYENVSLPDRVTNVKQRKVFWASRLSEQKRVDILPLLTQLLRDAGVELDVYGSIDRIEKVDLKKINYCGTFDSIDQIDMRQYSCFIYTSMYDGMPNILLEIAGKEIPIVAPDNVGGLADLVDEFKAWPVSCNSNNEETARMYRDVVLKILSSPSQAVEKSLRMKKYVQVEYSRAQQLKEIERLFSLHKKCNKNDLVKQSHSMLEIIEKICSFMRQNYLKSNPNLGFDFSTISKAMESRNLLEDMVYVSRKHIVSVYQIATFLRRYPRVYNIAKKAYRSVVLNVSSRV